MDCARSADVDLSAIARQRLNAKSLFKLVYDLDLPRLLRSVLSWLSLISCVFCFKLLYGVCMLTTSLSCEDQLLLFDCLALNDQAWSVVLLDTNKLFNEVRALFSRLRFELGKRCLVWRPVWASVLCHGRLSRGLSVYSSFNVRGMCCKVRKVFSLRSNVALCKVELWITGLRKLQSEFRGVTCAIQHDSKFDCVKLNPVLAWRTSDSKRFVISRFVEHNCMLISGYKSVGCAPCTRAVRGDERARAGRWWWERAHSFKSECGLHIR
ncbi:Phosphoadenosine phosphosulfate reductase [Candidatus Hodgkinia cicadicola]|nr:Phosphoadenosine phosphosulfate reductase [Candidatus Hodgkinia cicadicola]